MKILLSDIVIGERQRAYNEAHALQLSESMRDIGQIHNIGCHPTPDGKHVLIWGRHRYEGAKLLGWTEIEAVSRMDVSPEIEQELEYEEDARRLDRTWQEKCTAVAKLKRLKEKRTGETWSYRKMADFTGVGKSSIGYMMQVAEALNAAPRDEEMWACDNYLSAIKLLMVRTRAPLDDLLNQQRAAFEVVEEGTPALPFTDDASPDAPVQLLDTPLEETIVYIHWNKKAFRDAVPGEDFLAGKAQCILGYKVKSNNVQDALANERFAVIWNVQGGPFNYNQQPWSLVWNNLSQEETEWPFSQSWTPGTVLCNRLPTTKYNSPHASVITAAQDDPNHLASAVVEYCIDAVCPYNMPVFCIGGVRPLHVAMTGHTPIFFEPNEILAAQYIEELRAFYEETIPGVKVEVRS